MTAALTMRFDGEERARMHVALHGLMGLGSYTESGLEEADRLAADIARVDATLLTDRLGSAFGPRLNLAGDELPPTCGTWCMFAATRKFTGVLGVARDAGISMDDPTVFLTGGLFSHRTWLRDPAMVAKALALGASPDATLKATDSDVETMSVAEALFSWMPLTYRTADVQGLFQSFKLILEGGALYPRPDAMLAGIEDLYGMGGRSTVLACLMRGEIARARRDALAAAEPITAPAPARARIRI